MSAEALFKTDCLAGEGLSGSQDWALPCPHDDEVAALVTAWLTLSEIEQRIALRGLNAERAEVLNFSAERMASIAVRERNDGWIVIGTVAAGLSTESGDFRESLSSLALLLDAAHILDDDVTILRGAALLPPRASQWVKSFVSRDPENRSLEAFLYVRSEDESGFRYVRTW